MLVAEDSPQIVPTDPAASASDQALPASDQPDTLITTGSLQNATSESLPSDATGFQAVEQSSALQRPVQDLHRQTQVLHVCLGPLPDAHSSCKAFYFLRNQPGKLAVEDMEFQIDCGMLSEGPSLKMLQQVRLSLVLSLLSVLDTAQIVLCTSCLARWQDHLTAKRYFALQVLSSVFVPLLAQQASGDKHMAAMGSGDDRGQSGLLNEFLADLHKFVGQVGQTMHELQGMHPSLCLLWAMHHLACFLSTKIIQPHVHNAICLVVT